MLKWFRKIDQMITGRGRVDEELFEDLEELLVQADVSISTTGPLLQRLRDTVESQRLSTADEVKTALRAAMVAMLAGADTTLRTAPEPPTVYLLVGVNGSGKTTTVAKLAYRFGAEGCEVLVAAADTFRAAAIDQVEVWAERVAAQVVRHREGSDPAAVVFDAIQAGKSRGAEYVIVDTAGRLHTKTNLMAELSKIGRIVERELGRPAAETLLVLDATTGQNALSQAREFAKAVPLSGLVLTKVDGTAKGGVALSLRHDVGVPIKLVGLGERQDQLEDFNADRFVARLFEE